MKNILTFGLLILAAYWLAGVFFHFSMFGGFLFFPLAFCALMFFFMGHGEKSRREHKTDHD